MINNGSALTNASVKLLYPRHAVHPAGRGFRYLSADYVFNRFGHGTAREPANRAFHDDEACRRLFDETVNILEEATGRVVPRLGPVWVIAMKERAPAEPGGPLKPHGIADLATHYR